MLARLFLYSERAILCRPGLPLAVLFFAFSVRELLQQRDLALQLGLFRGFRGGISGGLRAGLGLAPLPGQRRAQLRQPAELQEGQHVDGPVVRERWRGRRESPAETPR